MSDRSQVPGVVLRLFVSGDVLLSEFAQFHLRELCTRLGSDVEVEVVDVIERPEAAEEHGVLATPMLERVAPPPALRVVGDLSDLEGALDGLGLRAWKLREPRSGV